MNLDGWLTEFKKGGLVAQQQTISSPLVSIVIASLNREELIGKAIDSALNQSYSQVEVVVVDGNSKDLTVEILKAYGSRIKWISEPDQGESDAYNKGLNLSRGEIVCFLPSDDMLLPDAVTLAVTEFQSATSDVAMVQGDLFVVDENDHIIGFEKGRALDAYYLTHINVSRVMQGTTFLRRRAVEEVGGWNVGGPYVLANDLDLWLRILSKYSSRYVQSPFACYRRHPGSQSISRFRDCLLACHRVRRLHGGPLVCPEAYRELRSLLRHTVRSLATQ